MSDDTQKPLPPLTARTADGKKLYTRFADVEAEIREVWCRPPQDWIALKRKLKSETLVFLIRKAGLKDDYIRGELVGEADARAVRISKKHVKGFDEVLKEEIVLEVQGKIFNLVWSDANSAQTDFLEISFAQKVRDLTKNVIESYKGSVMAERDQLDFWTGAEAEGEYDLVELRRDVVNLSRDPEEVLLLIEDESRRDELCQKIEEAVSDPRHFQALYLFEALDKSLAEAADHFVVTIRQIRYWKDTAMHQIRLAFGIETEEKRKALNQRRRERRASRRAESGAQPKAAQRELTIRPSSQLPREAQAR